MDRAVTMGGGFVWRHTLVGVLIHPRDGMPFRLDARAGRVVAALDRARPLSVPFSHLQTVIGTETDPPPANAEQWLEKLLALLESVDLVNISPAEPPTVPAP